MILFLLIVAVLSIAVVVSHRAVTKAHSRALANAVLGMMAAVGAVVWFLAETFTLGAGL